MPQSFTITNEDKTKRSLKIFIAGDLHLTKNIFFPGYWYITEFGESVPTKDMTSKHLVVSGSYIEPTGVISDRIEGWVSTNDEAVIPAGTYRRESPNGAELWCIRKLNNPDGRVDHVSVIQLQPGEATTVTEGQSLFVAEGCCEAGGRALAQEMYFKVTGASKEVKAQTRAHLLVWTQTGAG